MSNLTNNNPSSLNMVRYGSRQQGISMVEVLVAISIGIILLAGIINIYVASKRTYQTNNEITNFQENGRYVASRLGEELRMAGHAGCVDTFERGLTFISGDFSAGAGDFYGTPVQGFEYTAISATPDPSLPKGTAAPATGRLSPTPMIGSDILSIQYSDSNLTEITTEMTSPSDDLLLKTSGSQLGVVKEDDVMVIADCSEANVFLADSGSNAGKVVHTNPLIKNFTKSDEGLWPTVMRFRSNTYYVGSQNVLYQRDNLTGQTVKLFDGISKMDIVYGVTSTAGTRYLNATELNSENLMSQVQIIKIVYTLRSQEKMDLGSTSDYTEREFITTIVLRNQA